jgi:hypothetical protein
LNLPFFGKSWIRHSILLSFLKIAAMWPPFLEIAWIAVSVFATEVC